MRAEQLTPERRLDLGLHSAHHHLARPEAVEKLHQEVIGLGGQLANLDREHGRRAARDPGAGIERAHLRSHDLPAVAGVVQDVGQHRGVEVLGDAVEVFGGVPVHASPYICMWTAAASFIASRMTAS